jgi:hypothetical protein
MREPPTRSSDYALAARACRAAGQAAHAARLDGLAKQGDDKRPQARIQYGVGDSVPR